MTTAAGDPSDSTGGGASQMGGADAARAGIARIAFGMFALVVIPLAVPAMAPYRPIAAAYLAAATLIQICIKKNIGGSVRIFLGGAIDISLCTFLVQRMGTRSTPFVSLYLLITILNALVVPLPIARRIAFFGMASYLGVLLCEAAGWLPYGPDRIAFDTDRAPTPGEALTSGLLLSMIVAISTIIVGQLVQSLRRREEELREVNHRLEELSQRDPLTQISNRRHLMERVEAELARVRRGSPMAALMLDLDNFKHVNDQRGHAAGDEALQKIARAIESTTRDIDVAGRYGGDEFAVMLADADLEQARLVASRLVAAVHKAGAEMDPEKPVTVSIGISLARPTDDARSVLRRADQGAYEAKQQGGDRFAYVEVVEIPEPDRESSPGAEILQMPDSARRPKSSAS